MEVKEIAKLLKGNEGLIILEYVLDMSRSEILLNPDMKIEGESLEKVLEVVEKRKNQMPLQYAIGKWNFYGRDFAVSKNVLIPRPETELLVERVLKENTKKKSLLDICTGTGAIAISLDLEGRFERVIASDISSKALGVAKDNVMVLNSKVELVQSDLFDSIEGRFDIITANPPYINKKDMKKLSSEVLQEPELALYGGEDGLDFYKRIISSAPEYLKENGMLVLEIGYDQGLRVRDLMQEYGFTRIELVKDLNAFDRIVLGYLSS